MNKRYIVHYDKNDNSYYIHDGLECDWVTFGDNKHELEGVAFLLNKFHEENLRLREQLERLAKP